MTECPDSARKLYDICHCCVYSEKLLMMDRNCLKHVEFYSKNKFEKLVHLFGFIINMHECYGPPRLSDLTPRHFFWVSRPMLVTLEELDTWKTRPTQN